MDWPRFSFSSHFLLLSLFGSKLGIGRILDLSYGAIWRCLGLRVLLQLRRKWTSLDEIWNTLSTLADFGRDPRSSDSLRGRRNFVVFCQVNNTRFPVGQISRNLNTTTSIGVAMKTFGTEFWKFYRKGSFFQNTKIFLTKFQRLATSGRHNYAMSTDLPKFTTKRPSTGCLVSIFTVRIKSKSFPGLYAPRKKGKLTYPNFWQRPMSNTGWPSTPLCCLADRPGRKADWIENWNYWKQITRQTTLTDITQSQACDTGYRRMQEVNSFCTEPNTVLCSFHTIQPSSFLWKLMMVYFV